MTRSGTRILVGAVLIVFGGLLLLHQLHIWSYNQSMVWGALMTVGGLVLAANGFVERRNGKIFFGTWAFLYGLFLILRLLSMLTLFPHIKVFALVLSLALSFMMLWILEPRNFGRFISACCLGGVAVWIYFQSTNQSWADDLGEFARIYWPVVLILFGVNALVRRRG